MQQYATNLYFLKCLNSRTLQISYIAECEVLYTFEDLMKERLPFCEACFFAYIIQKML